MTVSYYIGIDYGTSTCGIAVGQSLTATANPEQSIYLNNGKCNPQDLDKLIQQWHPHAFVMGYPLNQDGTPTKVAPKAKKFAQWLHKQFQLPVYLVDERNSSTSAREILFERHRAKGLNKNKVDQIAACLLLEAFLDTGDYLELITAP